MITADYLELDGDLCYVERAGVGPTVLLLHTAGQSGVQWRDALRRLPQLGYSVVVPDLPGHGRSDPPSWPITRLEDYTQWCIRMLETLDVVRPIVVGCSVGGKLALDLALQGDVATAPAAIVAMACDAWNPQLSARSLRSWFEDCASPSRGDRTYYGTLASCGAGVPPDRARRIALMHRREDPIVSALDLSLWAEHDIRESLAEIRCPALLLTGEDDFWVSVADAAWAAGQMKNAAYGLLPGVGHYPMEEIVGFPDVLARWIGALSDGTPPADIANDLGLPGTAQ